MLLVFPMKCCTKMPCPMPHNHYWCLLSSPTCLPHLLICTCLISSPTACPPSSALCWCLLRIFLLFLIYANFFVTPLWIVCGHIFVWLVFIYHFVLAVCLICVIVHSILFTTELKRVFCYLTLELLSDWLIYCFILCELTTYFTQIMQHHS